MKDIEIKLENGDGNANWVKGRLKEVYEAYEALNTIDMNFGDLFGSLEAISEKGPIMVLDGRFSMSTIQDREDDGGVGIEVSLSLVGDDYVNVFIPVESFFEHEIDLNSLDKLIKALELKKEQFQKEYNEDPMVWH